MSEVRTQIQPTVISLFAGCGGSSCGYKMAGYKELLAVEFNKNQAKLFKLNFPEVPLWYGDVHKLSVDEIKQITGLKTGELDVLDGSPPCQGFSLQGKKKLADKRNQLFYEYSRILKGLKPKVFVAENVSGLVSGKMKFAFNLIFKELEDSGYNVRCRLLNAANYQVPQKRQRTIFIGTRKDLNQTPTFPLPIYPRCGVKKLDSRKRKWWHNPKLGKGFNPDIVKEGQQIRTLTKKTSVFWNKEEEFGLKSYSYASGFPDFYKWSQSWQANQDARGNCVPPLMMYHIANHVKQILVKNSENDVSPTSN